MTGLAAISIGSKLLGVKQAIGSAFRWVTASATHLLAMAASLALLWGFYERSYWKHEDTKHSNALQSCDTARKAEEAQWKKQVAAAKAATAQALKDGKDAATDAQTYHDQLVATTGELHSYIASHRVQSHSAPTPASPGTDNAAQVLADTPTVPSVAVPESVLNTCDADYTYAASAYKLGQDLLAKGLGTPSK